MLKTKKIEVVGLVIKISINLYDYYVGRYGEAPGRVRLKADIEKWLQRFVVTDDGVVDEGDNLDDLDNAVTAALGNIKPQQPQPQQPQPQPPQPQPPHRVRPASIIDPNFRTEFDRMFISADMLIKKIDEIEASPLYSKLPYDSRTKFLPGRKEEAQRSMTYNNITNFTPKQSAWWADCCRDANIINPWPRTWDINK